MILGRFGFAEEKLDKGVARVVKGCHGFLYKGATWLL